MSIIIGNPYIDKECKNKIKTNLKNKISVLNNLKKILTKLKINVIKIDDNKECNLIWIRDLFFKIDNKIFICNNTKNDSLKIDRTNEKQYLMKYFKNFIIFPKNINIEGGDIIQVNNFIFVGINERTNIAAIKFLEKIFPKKIFINIYHSAIHLDCCFTVIDKFIFYSRKYIKRIPKFLHEKYFIINIDEILCTKNTNLATNLLIINNNIITTDTPEFKPFRILLEILGYNVYTIKYYNLLEEGGGIRCLTQWL